MNNIGVCGILSNSNDPLSKYKEQVTLNTIVGLTSDSINSDDNKIYNLGIYNDPEKMIKDCKKKKINKVYLTSKDKKIDFKGDTNGIDIMWF